MDVTEISEFFKRRIMENLLWEFRWFKIFYKGIKIKEEEDEPVFQEIRFRKRNHFLMSRAEFIS